MKNKKGFLLITVLFCIPLILSAAVFLASLCGTLLSIDRSKLNELKAFYLAEAGIEMAKTKLAANPSWFTDPSHSDYDKQWLLSSASGEIYLFGSGGFKIVKEQNKLAGYSVGFIGNDIRKSGYYCFQRIVYELPFKVKGWEKF